MIAGAPVAALPMYDFPEIAAANDALWASIARRLRAQGLEAPERLERGRSLAALWRDPQLLFAQVCGYPYAKGLSDAVVLIATPQYAFPGCEGALHSSFVVSRADDPRRSLEAFRGSVATVNGFDSNSGMNLFRATIARVARGATFFGAVVTTDSHVASLEAVTEGRADLAAVDCVTFGLMQRLRPRLVEPIRIVAESPLSPGLPFVASARLPDATVAAVLDALASAMADGELAETLGALGLAGLHLTAPADYEQVLEIEQAAEAAGYPELA
jgi:ABC-type phosphate/phosphonate transport system substrate-binding protein